MDALFEFLNDIAGGESTLVVSIFVFLSAAVLAFGMMAVIQVRIAVKRRAAGINSIEDKSATDDSRSLRYASKVATQRLLEYTSKHYSGENAGDVKELRRRLIQAGYLDARAPALFFLARTVAAVVLAILGFLAAPYVLRDDSAMFWPMVLIGGILGYFAPNLYLSRIISVRTTEHRTGFPDFMDLLVVCADAGLSMESALDRVGRELAESYPSLSANIHMGTLEIRAGRTMTDALEHLADRLGLEEAGSFAHLLQQSAELGSSITDALRVSSDDMRHKRLSRAEEKDYRLPSRLAVPMMVS